MDTRSTRTLLVRLGVGLCVLGAVAAAVTAAAMATSRQALHDGALLLSGVAVLAGLLLAAVGKMLALLPPRADDRGLYHGPESSTLSFAPPSLGTLPARRRLPNLRRTR